MMETNLIGEMDMLREMDVHPNFSEMARRYGIDRHTVARYWKEGTGMEDGRSARCSGFDAYRAEIEDRAQIPGVTMKGIHEWLPGRHPDSGLPKYGASRHWMSMRGIRAGQPAPDAHPRYETEPGRQLQFDWKERLLLHGRDGTEYRFNVWTATLGFSRRHIFLRSDTLTTDDFEGCAWQTAARLGGVPSLWLTDNMSALVTIGPDGKRHRVERAFSFAGRMGFRTGLCAPRTPQTKGKDESSNRFVRRLLAYDRDVD